MVSTNHFRNRRLARNRAVVVRQPCNCPTPVTPPPTATPLLQLFYDWQMTDGLNFFTLGPNILNTLFTTDVDSATNGRTNENNADWLITALTRSSTGDFSLELFLTPDGDVQHHAATVNFGAAPTWTFQMSRTTTPADDWATTIAAEVVAAADNIIG